MFRGIRDIVDEIERPQRLERRTRAHRPPGRAGLATGRRPAAARPSGGSPSASAACGTTYDVLLMPMLSAPAVPAQLMEGRGATVTYLWESGWVPFGVLWNSTGQPAASRPRGLRARRPAAGRPARRRARTARARCSRSRRRSRPRARGYLTARAPSIASVPRRMAGCRICSGELELKVRGNGAAVTAAALSPSAHAVGRPRRPARAAVECGTVQQPILPAGDALHDLYRDMRDDDVPGRGGRAGARPRTACST